MENKITKWSVILGIVIVLNLFFNYTLSLVYDSPVYDNFCPQSQVVNVPDNQNECVNQGGQWTENAYYMKPVPQERYTEPLGYCDLQYSCRQEYDKVNGTYSRNVFVILVVLGALAVAVGNFFVGNTVISNGLSLGGVLSFIIASIRYWSAADDLFRVIILAISLGLLLWIAWKKFGNSASSV